MALESSSCLILPTASAFIAGLHSSALERHASFAAF